MHRTLLRFLLLAVFFNTALGMPWHVAQHLPGDGHFSTHAQAAEHAAQGASAAQAHDEDEAGDVHSTCAGCLAQAQQGHALGMVRKGVGPAAPVVQTRRPHTAERVAAQGERWPFASRDPPHPHSC